MPLFKQKEQLVCKSEKMQPLPMLNLHGEQRSWNWMHWLSGGTQNTLSTQTNHLRNANGIISTSSSF